MKVLIVNNYDAKKLPPVINLIDALTANGYYVEIISYDTSGILQKYKDKIKIITLHWPAKDNWIYRKLIFLLNRYLMRAYVRREMKECDLIWSTTDKTLRELGNMIFQYKYIMQLQELVKNVQYAGLKKLPLRFSLKKYAKRACKVVVPEYNRAHFLKIWFKLDELPSVFPNKPYSLNYEENEVPEEVKDYIRELEKEKRVKIIYQGCFSEDRNFAPIIEYVERNKDRYCLIIVGYDMQNKKQKKMYEKYRKKEFLYPVSFILHPYYLELTKKADIGLLPYVPSDSGNGSLFNALYCAPNKIYEYAWCGVPMIGPDIPGLRYPFEEYNIGRVYKESSQLSVQRAIEEVMERKEEMAANCLKFYEATDLDNILDEILS